MLSQHWTDFTPSTSGVDNFYGGIHPEYSIEIHDNERRAWAAITYRLKVASAQNGWHHHMAMYTGIQGVAFSNASVKQDCRPGYYQMCLTFHFIKPYYLTSVGASGPQGEGGNTDNYMWNSWYTSMFYGTGSPDYGTAGNWSNGKVMDVMVFRPTLVDPTNSNNFVQLWTPSAYNGWQPFFTGIPLVDPNKITDGQY